MGITSSSSSQKLNGVVHRDLKPARRTNVVDKGEGAFPGSTDLASNRRRAPSKKIRECTILMLHAGKKYHAITPLVAASYSRHVTLKGRAKGRKWGSKPETGGTKGSF